MTSAKYRGFDVHADLFRNCYYESVISVNCKFDKARHNDFFPSMFFLFKKLTNQNFVILIPCYYYEYEVNYLFKQELCLNKINYRFTDFYLRISLVLTYLFQSV